MKLQTIHVDGFGVWNLRRWEGLSAGLNVFHGPNEAGKTTLMSFARSVLFGFERRNHPRRYEPLRGGEYGGWLDLEWRGRDLRVERRGGRHVRGRVEVRPVGEGSSSDLDRLLEAGESERALELLLGGTTRTLYHNVFAFGLEELEHIRTLEENEVAAHISGAGMGVGAKRWSQVWKDLEERRSGLFLPRGQNSTLNQAFRELEDVREELDRTEAEPEEYFRAREARDLVCAEISELEAEVATLEARIGHYRKLREAEPYRRRRKALDAELKGLAVIESFPENGVARLNLLFDQRSRFETEIAKKTDQIAAIRRERQDLTRGYAPQDLIRRSRAVESLRHLLPRRDASEEVVAGVTGRRDAVLMEQERLETRQARLAPPPLLSMALFSVLIAAGGAGLGVSGYPASYWVAGGLLLWLGFWYLSRKRAAGGLDADIADCAARRTSAEADLERAMGEGREIAAAIGRRVGRSDFSYVDLETEAERVRELGETADRLRAIEERLESADAEREKVRGYLQDTGAQIRKLLEEGGADSESAFFRRAGIFARRTEVIGELRRMPAGEVEQPEGVEPLDGEGFEDASARYERAVVRLNDARTEGGRLEERLARLGRSEERSRARLRQESVMARVGEASEKWAVLTLCRTLLADTRRIYETERQPEVLTHASAFFERMTGGRWVRVISPLESGILVESPDGVRVEPEHLSRGTAEQLYLAMRLALVREYSRHVEPLPVVLDDIFVNFDPDRTRRSIEAVGELARTHQVLLFTCHPHLVGIVQEIVPSAEIYPLQ